MIFYPHTDLFWIKMEKVSAACKIPVPQKLGNENAVFQISLVCHFGFWKAGHFLTGKLEFLSCLLFSMAISVAFNS